MKKLIPTFLLFGALSFCIFSFGQGSNLEQCSGIDSDLERLICYDSVTASTPAETVAVAPVQPAYCSLAEHSWSTECGGNIAPGYCSASQNASRTECGGGGFYQIQQLIQKPAYCSAPDNSSRTECGGTANYQSFVTQPQQLRMHYQLQQLLPEYCSAEQYAWRTECGGSVGIYEQQQQAQQAQQQLPAYCSTAANASRTECGGGGLYQAQQNQ